jgi:hypothetical protein
MNVLGLANVKDASVVEHSRSASRLFDIVVAIEVKQASNP